jgi:hypothetical protein
MPRVAKSTLFPVSSNTRYVSLVIVQVIVMSPDVLLKIETTSPAAKVASGIVIDPLATYLNKFTNITDSKGVRSGFS